MDTLGAASMGIWSWIAVEGRPSNVLRALRAGREHPGVQPEDAVSAKTHLLPDEGRGRGSLVELLAATRSSETATSTFCAHEKLDAVQGCYDSSCGAVAGYPSRRAR